MIPRKCAALGTALLAAGVLATTPHDAAAAEKTCPYTSSTDRPTLRRIPSVIANHLVNGPVRHSRMASAGVLSPRTSRGRRLS
jgi:hypothetical protein